MKKGIILVLLVLLAGHWYFSAGNGGDAGASSGGAGDVLRTAGYYLSALSVPQIIFLVVFILIAGFIAFAMIYGKSPSSRGFWDDLIRFAIDNNATNLLVANDSKAKMKVNGEWRELGFPLSAQDIARLKAFQRAEPGDWTVRGTGLAHLIRNEEDTVEWELRAGPY